MFLYLYKFCNRWYVIKALLLTPKTETDSSSQSNSNNPFCQVLTAP